MEKPETPRKPATVQINDFCKIQPTNVITNRYDIYLNYLIEKPHYYFEFLEILRSAESEDEIFIHLNNNGGYLDTTMQIINTMKGSKANITTCLEGACHSAASLILLSGDAFKISEYGTMLCHYYSGGTSGKGHEMEAHIEFDKNYYKKFFKKIYNKFLTKKEIEEVIKGKDLWLSASGIIKRLKSMEPKGL